MSPPRRTPSTTAKSVTFAVANHPANPVSWAPKEGSTRAVSTLDQFLVSCSPKQAQHCTKILQTSFREEDVDSLIPKRNGFVHTVLDAYSQHHHLQLRPDDMWMTILSQFSCFVNANVEYLRSKFVAHEGKQDLIVRRDGTRYTVDFGGMALEMTTLIDKFVVDPELKDWILPKFSTTTPSDTIIYAIQMMATLKAYFEYTFKLICGIPTITLLGEKDDWEALLGRIEKLHSFGPEAEQWARLLTPILTRFVEAFDGKTNIEFWGHVPQAYCDCPVTLDDNGVVFDTTLIAGHMATAVIQNPNTKEWDTMRPAPGWYMFVEDQGPKEVERVEAKKLKAELEELKAMADSKEEEKLIETSRRIHRWHDISERLREIGHLA
ncbi:hypothetical protein BDN72DRAFT_900080 [Pluteus cervinus]|uniref:Uncharacterized protein n=1 Tax=Pluteus cervinus TaxID=181527 RepID=A0ACD3AML1_9AGAR|nr:hypothetical protein BDN72DRAFT_900080 [Pluteus cervinus]